MHTLRDSVLEPVVYHLNPAKSDTSTFRNVVKWMPSAISSYAAYAFKVCIFICQFLYVVSEIVKAHYRLL